jgi:hypothetical protein
MSASSFLGFAGLIFFFGLDGLHRPRRRARRVSILVGLAFAVAASAKRAAFSRFGEDRFLSRDYLHRSSDGP